MRDQSINGLKLAEAIISTIAEIDRVVRYSTKPKPEREKIFLPLK